MITISQLVRKSRIKKIYKKTTPALQGCPYKRGICIKTYVVNPKKPNSAQRKVARVHLFNRHKIVAFIPGEEPYIKQYGEVLVRGGRVKDLPGIKYKILRGVKNCPYTKGRINKRSKYGLKIIDAYHDADDLIVNKYPWRFK